MNFNILSYTKTNDMKFRTLAICSILSLILFSACTSNDKKDEKIVPVETKTPKLKEEEIVYNVDSLKMHSFVVYDENVQGKRPAVLVVHEWWGLNDYIKRRARQLAELGYIAMAVDMYGNDRKGANPDEAGKLAMPFYQNPQIPKKHFDAGVTELLKYPQTDTSKMAAMGYCFGGGVVIGVANLGEDLKGVVSFHGNLTVVPPNKDLLKADILVCHGEADSLVKQSEVDAFKKQMDAIGKPYTFRSYPNAQHAFTNPQATEWGQKFKIPVSYNGPADTASWNEMKLFFGKIFK